MTIINSVSKILCLLILTAMVAAGFLTTAMAQTSTSVSGRILDENSAAIPGAQITAVKNGANLENIFNKKYSVNAHSNDNISPGYPRAARLSLTWKF